MVVCRSCLADIVDGARYCLMCGAKCEDRERSLNTIDDDHEYDSGDASPSDQIAPGLMRPPSYLRPNSSTEESLSPRSEKNHARQMSMLVKNSAESWTNVQQKTFTRWTNIALIERGLHLDSIEVGMDTGVQLIELVELLSGKKVGRYNKNPKMDVQKAENINVALNFLRDEGIKFVNVGAQDIIKGNLKILLGLVWTLICHYQIGDSVNDSAQGRLLKFVNSRVEKYGLTATNFSKDWQDGKLLSALTNSLYRGDDGEDSDLLPMSKLGSPLEALEAAMDAAETYFSVPRVIDPEDVLQTPDAHSIMTYVSYFQKAVEALAAEEAEAAAELAEAAAAEAEEDEEQKRIIDPKNCYALSQSLDDSDKEDDGDQHVTTKKHGAKRAKSGTRKKRASSRARSKGRPSSKGKKKPIAKEEPAHKSAPVLAREFHVFLNDQHNEAFCDHVSTALHDEEEDILKNRLGNEAVMSAVLVPDKTNKGELRTRDARVMKLHRNMYKVSIPRVITHSRRNSVDAPPPGTYTLTVRVNGDVIEGMPKRILIPEESPPFVPETPPSGSSTSLPGLSLSEKADRAAEKEQDALSSAPSEMSIQTELGMAQVNDIETKIESYDELLQQLEQANALLSSQLKDAQKDAKKEKEQEKEKEKEKEAQEVKEHEVKHKHVRRVSMEMMAVSKKEGLGLADVALVDIEPDELLSKSQTVDTAEIAAEVAQLRMDLEKERQANKKAAAQQKQLQQVVEEQQIEIKNLKATAKQKQKSVAKQKKLAAEWKQKYTALAAKAVRLREDLQKESRKIRSGSQRRSVCFFLVFFFLFVFVCLFVYLFGVVVVVIVVGHSSHSLF